MMWNWCKTCDGTTEAQGNWTKEDEKWRAERICKVGFDASCEFLASCNISNSPLDPSLFPYRRIAKVWNKLERKDTIWEILFQGKMTMSMLILIILMMIIGSYRNISGWDDSNDRLPEEGKLLIFHGYALQCCSLQIPWKPWPKSVKNCAARAVLQSYIMYDHGHYDPLTWQIVR